MEKVYLNWTFFGTDEFSVKILETLIGKGLLPSLIITTPDKPKGRKMILTPPPVKVWAQENDISFLQPSSLKDPDFTRKLKAVSCKLFLVASYGKIIPNEILDLPEYNTLNIHPSLLPKYRGPSPLATAILNGDLETGVTIIKLDEEMDHGPILAQKCFQHSNQGIPLLNFEQLRDKTAELGAEMFAEILPEYFAGKIISQEQNHAEATYTKKLAKQDGELNLSEPAIVNYRKILALNPWPGAYFFHEHHGKKIRVNVKTARFEGGNLIFEKVIPASGREMNWQAFLNGIKLGKNIQDRFPPSRE